MLTLSIILQAYEKLLFLLYDGMFLSTVFCLWIPTAIVVFVCAGWLGMTMFVYDVYLSHLSYFFIN